MIKILQAELSPKEHVGHEVIRLLSRDRIAFDLTTRFRRVRNCSSDYSEGVR